MNNNLKKIIQTLPPWILTGITLLIILWLTLSPRPFGSLETPFFSGADKLAHALMFGFLVAMMALDRTRKRDFHRLSPLYLICCAIFSSLLGVAIEYLQEALKTGRAFEYIDMVADSCGAFAAAFIWLIFQPKSVV
ncbi:MAG: VanZ family protein [Muribaculaceae bacterium]|nr:VanZ family protein [Muribaculaceae bacterium]